MQIESKYLNYSVGAITFEAYCAYQPSRQKQPAVLVAPAWAGRGDFVCQKAKMLVSSPNSRGGSLIFRKYPKMDFVFSELNWPRMA